MKAIKLIVSVGLVAMTFLGCNKEKHPLTEVDKQMIPYKMGDTIRFIDENGRLSTFPVVEDRISWEEENAELTPVTYESKQVTLKSERSNQWIWLTISAWTTPHKTTRFISFSEWSFLGAFRIYYDSEGRFRTDVGQYQYVYDNIEINGKVYYDVCFVRGWDEAQRELYYNTDYGILQVKNSGRNIFTLVP